MAGVRRRRKDICLIYYFYKLHYKRPRKYWVHPFISARLLKGAFTTMFCDLREDEAKFFNYFRMSLRSFDELCAKISDYIRGQDTNMRLAISPQEMLAVILRYLGSGCNLIDLHYSYRIGRSTLSTIVRKTCRTIYHVLQEDCLPKLTEELWREICDRFERKANFPNCLGALDGKHVRIIKPTMTGSLYYNYKNFFSIVLFAIADADYKFIYFDVGSFGKEGDSVIFEQSTFYRKLESKFLNIPPPKPLPGVEGSTFPHIFIGDAAFSLSEHILRPYVYLTKRRYITID